MCVTSTGSVFDFDVFVDPELETALDSASPIDARVCGCCFSLSSSQILAMYMDSDV